ncbi:MAG: hypothetical protein ACOC56_05570 [Atribacterota bacterium]
MIISHKLKLIYSHIPKTAGSSMKNAIQSIDPNAKNIKHYHSIIKRGIINKYPNYNKITIVRNSYQIVASRYRFREVYAKKNK